MLSCGGTSLAAPKRGTALDGEKPTLANLASDDETIRPCRNLAIGGMRRRNDAVKYALIAGVEDLSSLASNQ